jgi:hypothetical protein
MAAREKLMRILRIFSSWGQIEIAPSKASCRITVIRPFFAMGKIRGTPSMRSYISVHRATSKYFPNSFIFKKKFEKEGLPRDSTPDLGAGGPRFKSGRPDQKYLGCFLLLIESVVHPQTHLWNSGRQEVSIHNSFNSKEFGA